MISRVALRPLASLLSFVSKVGKELILEIERDRLALRTLNDAKSAFAHITFENSGGENESFEEYSVSIPEGEDEAAFRVSVKPICSIMKSLKKVQSLVMYTELLANGHDKLVFEMVNDTGIRRTHKFDYQDAEIVNAHFDEEVSSRLVVEPKILSNLLDHLHQTSGEIEVEVSESKFKVKSFHQEPGPGDRSCAVLQRVMTTEMCLETSEFEQYEYRYLPRNL